MPCSPPFPEHPQAQGTLASRRDQNFLRLLPLARCRHTDGHILLLVLVSILHFEPLRHFTPARQRLLHIHVSFATRPSDPQHFTCRNTCASRYSPDHSLARKPGPRHRIQEGQPGQPCQHQQRRDAIEHAEHDRVARGKSGGRRMNHGRRKQGTCQSCHLDCRRHASAPTPEPSVGPTSVKLATNPNSVRCTLCNTSGVGTSGNPGAGGMRSLRAPLPLPTHSSACTS
ncbi:hypothetical protein BCR44DRAFT_1277888 [Catenaria anguillulae PL171]|uniref:Uncharacterized protein n=1 Tax=Catenaria anguillulae PL171 TaxID=765915 RepID=A0A1Y2HDH1_9FUNG|nr:hypothetical protein BCR44DRAFT_1277888 [Catenaria anguillulae PL171]